MTVLTVHKFAKMWRYHHVANAARHRVTCNRFAETDDNSASTTVRVQFAANDGSTQSAFAQIDCLVRIVATDGNEMELAHVKYYRSRPLMKEKGKHRYRLYDDDRLIDGEPSAVQYWIPLADVHEPVDTYVFSMDGDVRIRPRRADDEVDTAPADVDGMLVVQSWKHGNGFSHGCQPNVMY